MRDGPQQKEEPMMQTWNLEGRRVVNWKDLRLANLSRT